MVRWTEEDLVAASAKLRNAAQKATETAMAPRKVESLGGARVEPSAAYKPSNAAKYRSQPTWRDGMRFPSRLQAKHYDELKLLKAAGLIRYFIREVRFDLPGAIHRIDWGIVMGNGELIWAESKGRDLSMGKLKRKQTEQIYGIEIRVWTKGVELPSP
jgi:hypothetical protein